MFPGSMRSPRSTSDGLIIKDAVNNAFTFIGASGILEHARRAALCRRRCRGRHQWRRDCRFRHQRGRRAGAHGDGFRALTAPATQNGEALSLADLLVLFLLERLLQSHRDHAAEQALDDVAGTRKTASGGDPVLVGCSLVHDVLHHDLDADVPQVLVRGPVSGVVAERQIERVVARLDGWCSPRPSMGSCRPVTRQPCRRA